MTTSRVVVSRLLFHYVIASRLYRSATVCRSRSLPLFFFISFFRWITLPTCLALESQPKTKPWTTTLEQCASRCRLRYIIHSQHTHTHIHTQLSWLCKFVKSSLLLLTCFSSLLSNKSGERGKSFPSLAGANFLHVCVHSLHTLALYSFGRCATCVWVYVLFCLESFFSFSLLFKFSTYERKSSSSLYSRPRRQDKTWFF